MEGKDGKNEEACTVVRIFVFITLFIVESQLSLLVVSRHLILIIRLCPRALREEAFLGFPFVVTSSPFPLCTRTTQNFA